MARKELQMSFLDMTEVKPDEGMNFELLPAGEYSLQCNKAEVRDTKAGTGQYISCEFRVSGGKYNNRCIFHMFNIKNPSEIAQQIGLGQLKAFMTFGGMQNPDVLETVSDLEGLWCNAWVKVQKDEQYGDKNVISQFKPQDFKEDSDTTSDNIPF